MPDFDQARMAVLGEKFEAPAVKRNDAKAAWEVFGIVNIRSSAGHADDGH